MLQSNPVIEVYHGIVIRKSNIFQLRMSDVLFKMLILESERTGLPISKILSYSSKPCVSCEGIDVVAFNDDGDKISVKRGILYNMKPARQGGKSIIKQKNAKSK